MQNLGGQTKSNGPEILTERPQMIGLAHIVQVLKSSEDIFLTARPQSMKIVHRS